jgi:hypothetical protein
MGRIVLTDGTGRWFDTDKAQSWEEGTRWDGHNHVSLCAERHGHERLFRTEGGIYVLHHWSQWQGTRETYEEITAKEAARWLSTNEHDDGDADKAGPEVASAYAALELT